jgi:hypothetical protein
LRAKTENSCADLMDASSIMTAMDSGFFVSYQAKTLRMAAGP